MASSPADASLRGDVLAAAGDVTVRAAAENQLTQAMRSLFAVAEAYPDLKANENMLSLQEELKSTENKIAFARQYYNDIVTAYNTKLQTFPTAMMASSMGFKPRAMSIATTASSSATISNGGRLAPFPCRQSSRAC